MEMYTYIIKTHTGFINTGLIVDVIRGGYFYPNEPAENNVNVELQNAQMHLWEFYW
jgi:hypothetical protein